MQSRDRVDIGSTAPSYGISDWARRTASRRVKRYLDGARAAPGDGGRLRTTILRWPAEGRHSLPIELYIMIE